MAALEVRLFPIENGTVLDHLPVGTAKKIVDILRLDHSSGAVTIAINTESKRLGRKDLIFIENRVLTPLEIEKIGLVAHGATWNAVENRDVVSKKIIALPARVEGIVQCLNVNCVSNRDRIPAKFRVLEKPIRAHCLYCERVMSGSEIQSAIR